GSWRSSRSAPSRLAPCLAALSGVIMAFGMAFTLAFLPVGLIVAIVILWTPAVSPARKAALILATGAGFVGLTALGWGATGANPAEIWRWNLLNHARFYVEYPRTYPAWLVANPVELAIALGLPSAVWCLAGFARPGTVPRAAWATLAVLCLMNLTGKNMGEV